MNIRKIMKKSWSSTGKEGIADSQIPNTGDQPVAGDVDVQVTQNQQNPAEEVSKLFQELNITLAELQDVQSRFSRDVLNNAQVGWRKFHKGCENLKIGNQEALPVQKQTTGKGWSYGLRKPWKSHVEQKDYEQQKSGHLTYGAEEISQQRWGQSIFDAEEASHSARHEESSFRGEGSREGKAADPSHAQYRDLINLVRQHDESCQKVASSLQDYSKDIAENIRLIFVLLKKLKSKLGDLNLLQKVKQAEVYRFPVSDESNVDEFIDSLWKEYLEAEYGKRRLEEQFLKAGENYQRNIILLDRKHDNELQEMKMSKTRQIERLEESLRGFEQEKASSSQNGSYLDTAATPTHLNDAVNKVKDMLLQFVRAFNADLSGAGLSVDLPKDDAVNCEVIIDSMDFARKIHKTRFRTAYFVSTTMFRGFEVDGFDVEGGYFSPTLDLEKYHASCYQEFQDMKSRNMSELTEELAANSQSRFVNFVKRKFFSIFPEPLWEEQWAKIDDSCFKEFLSLAAAVWLLQRLAMSFEPNARIFRVMGGVDFDPEYMTNVVDDDEDEASKFLPKVGFMVLPGFRVGKIIIRSQVYPQCSAEDDQ